MSYTNGFQTLVQSMNGLLTFNDGAGTIIENGKITTQSFLLNNIYANLPIVVVNLWTNFISGTASLLTNVYDGGIYIGTNLAPGTLGILSLGNQVCSITLGAMTFIGNTINTSLTTNLELFPTYNGATTNILTGVLNGTVNICNAMTSGTFNIGRGGNINVGSASTGVLLKIDGNGLSNQVLISPQSGASGTVKIGTNENSNQIGAVFVKNNFISASSGTTILSGTQRLGFNNTAYTQSFPAYFSMFCEPAVPALFTNVINYVCGGYTNRVYDVKQLVSSNGSQTIDGGGTLETYCRSSELIFLGESTTPQPNPIITSLEFGYYSLQDAASYIAAGAPYGGVSIGGCGSLNPSFSTAYQRAMTIYPYYGTRLYTGGLNFDKGNLTSAFSGGRGFFIQTGSYLGPVTVTPAQSTRTISQSLTSPFGGGIIVINVSGDTTCNQFTFTTSYPTGVLFNVVARNNSSASVTIAINFSWMAIGGYFA